MEKVKMTKFEISVAFDDETFEELLERLSAAVPSAYVRVLKLHGPSAGWPQLEVIIPESDIATFAKWYCEDDADMWEEMIRGDAESL